jgi:predicted RNA-binding Zn-ribbon protein involved in translation (DUF1610 family)
MKECPKCNFMNTDDSEECQKCGIIFKKFVASQKKEIAKKPSLLMKCKVCGKEISKNATSCPHCGEPITDAGQKRKNEQDQENKKQQQGTIALILFAIIVMFFFFDLHKHYLPSIFDKKPEMSFYELTKLPANEQKVYMRNFERKLCEWIIREQKRNPGLIIDARAADCREKLGLDK